MKDLNQELNKMREIQISLKKRIRGETEKQIAIQRKKNKEINSLKVIVSKFNLALSKAEKDIELKQEIIQERKFALDEAKTVSDKSFEQASDAHKVAIYAQVELKKLSTNIK